MTDWEQMLREGPDASADGAKRRFIDRAADLADVAFATMESPLGSLLIAVTERGLVRIGFDGEEAVLEDLADRISPRLLAVPGRVDPVRRQLDAYFDGRLLRFDLPLDWRLIGGFRDRVLRATVRIPFGRTSTYGELAAAVGSPRGARATGRALGGNPIPIVIPCHRVLQAGGRLGGYAGGLERKEFLLRLEGALL